MYEKTIINKVTFQDCGLYSGTLNKVTVRPLGPYNGIFINDVLSTPKNVYYVEGYTIVGNVKLIEHLTSCLCALGINNVDIIVESQDECCEIPIIDGSCEYFMNLFENNIYQYPHIKDFYEIPHKFKYEFVNSYDKIQNKNHKLLDRYISIKPHDQLVINCLIDFPYVNQQKYTFYFNKTNYKNEIMHYKTQMNVEYFNTCQLKGATPDNIFIYDENTVFKGDEIVKHKILDIIGDISHLPFNISGYIDSHCSGHGIHAELNKLIYDSYIKTKMDLTQTISLETAKLLIKQHDLKIYYDIYHFSFNIDLYSELLMYSENGFLFIFPQKPFDHWSPLLVYTNSHYTPNLIKSFKNCILGPSDSTCNVRYFWTSKGDFNNYLELRERHSNKPKKHFPTKSNYNNIANKLQHLEFNVINYDETIFYENYNKLKRDEHLLAEQIPIPEINKIKLCYLKDNNIMVAIGILVDDGKSITLLNLASCLKQLYMGVGYGFFMCVQLMKYYFDRNYVSFDLGISRVYGCYKNKLCIKKYKINEILDF